jgi:hypothetical protein
MKNTANAAPCRHRKLRPELRYDIDLFDVAREQEHLQSEAVRHIARFRDRRAAEWGRAVTTNKKTGPRANAGNRANPKVILADNPNGVPAFRDELVSLLKGLDREEQAAARGFFLTAWNGTASYTFDRIILGKTHIDAACLSLLGSTQPGRLAEYVRRAVSGGAGDDGIIQRFGLLVWPDQKGDWKECDRWPDTDGASVRITPQSFYEHLIALASAPPRKARARQTTSFQKRPRPRTPQELEGLRRGNEQRATAKRQREARTA